jgi:outer membrane lipoprotein carrier protein
MIRAILSTTIIASSLFATGLNIDSFKSDFKQTIINELNEKIVYTGNVTIKKPSLALWQYIKPIKKSVHLYEKRVYIIEPDLEQVTISTLKESINFIELLERAKKIDDTRYKTKINELDAILTIKSNKILKLTYTDSMSNNVEILFSNQHQNIDIENSYFRLVIPDGYDIIE